MAQLFLSLSVMARYYGLFLFIIYFFLFLSSLLIAVTFFGSNAKHEVEYKNAEKLAYINFFHKYTIFKQSSAKSIKQITLVKFAIEFFL